MSATIAQEYPVKKRPLAIDSTFLQHSERIGESLWLYLWAYDRVTCQCICSDNTLVGLVLGSSVISDERIAEELGRSVRWVQRWRPRAVEIGLLRIRRTPYGHQMAIPLWDKKFFRHAVTDRAPEWAEPGAKPKQKPPQNRVAKSGESESSNRGPDTEPHSPRVAESGKSRVAKNGNESRQKWQVQSRRKWQTDSP